MATKKHPATHSAHHPHHKHPAEHEPLLMQPSKLRGKTLAIVIALLVVVGGFFIYKSFAANDTLSLSPASSSPALGSSFTVTVNENSNTDSVNAVEADLTYDQSKLQFVSIDYSTSAFALQGTSSGGAGLISIARATTTALTGSHVVGVITFSAIGAGSANVNFAATSTLVKASDSTKIATITSGGTYTIADTQAPAVPTGLTAGTKTDINLALSWSASRDNVATTGYNILRNGTKIGTTATTSFSDTGLTPSTAYSYTVQAFDAAGNTSASSAALSMSTLADTTAPTAPTALTAGTKTVTSNSFSWTAARDDVAVSHYKVLRNSVAVNSNVTATSYTDSGLSPNTAYTYTVQAVDGSNNTSTASVGLAMTTLADTTPPSAPAGLISPSKTTTSISLSWNPANDDVGVTGYKVYRNGAQVGAPTTTSFNDTGLAQGTAYSYTVAATDAAGHTSAQSAASSFSTVLKLGDVNGDTKVDILDLSIIAAHWNQSATYSQGDLDHSGVVDILDLSILAAHWGS